MTVFGKKIDDKAMDQIASYMNDDIREELHQKLAPCTPEKFISAYLERDPGFKKLLEDEMNFDLEGFDVLAEEPKYIRIIFKSAGITKEEFCKRYGINKKTFESWLYNVRNCPDYVIDLLAKSVYLDIVERKPIYRIFETRIKSGDEFETYSTYSFTDAIFEARDRYRKDHEHYNVEIRLYNENNFKKDYTTIDYLAL